MLMKQETSDSTIRAKLEAYEASAGDVSSTAWNRLQQKLPSTGQHRKRLLWFALPAVAALLLWMFNIPTIDAPVAPARSVVGQLPLPKNDSIVISKTAKAPARTPRILHKRVVKIIEVTQPAPPSLPQIILPENATPIVTVDDIPTHLPSPKPLRKIHINKLYQEERESRTITAINEPPNTKPKTISNAWGLIKRENNSN